MQRHVEGMDNEGPKQVLKIQIEVCGPNVI